MMRFSTRLLAAALAAASATAAYAQFSDSYNFLKAVRDRDGAKATELVSKAGSVIIDTREGNGEGALHIVTKGRDLNWLSFLLSRGAKPDLKDSAGNTPLMIAAQIGFVEGAQALIRQRANVNLSNSAGETPIIRAVQNRDAAMVRVLIAAGANTAKTDSRAGLSARDYAARDPRATAILKIIEDTKPAAPARPVAGPK